MQHNTHTRSLVPESLCTVSAAEGNDLTTGDVIDAITAAHCFLQAACSSKLEKKPVVVSTGLCRELLLTLTVGDAATAPRELSATV